MAFGRHRDTFEGSDDTAEDLLNFKVASGGLISGTEEHAELPLVLRVIQDGLFEQVSSALIRSKEGIKMRSLLGDQVAFSVFGFSANFTRTDMRVSNGRITFAAP